MTGVVGWSWLLIVHFSYGNCATIFALKPVKYAIAWIRHRQKYLIRKPHSVNSPTSGTRVKPAIPLQ
jgi:hypothetical protein